MKVAGILQAVIILLLLASAASCEVSKEYANRVFRSQPVKKTDPTGLKFMEFDNDSASDTIELAKVFNKEDISSTTETKDSTKTEIPTETVPAKSLPVITESKKAPKDISGGSVRSKRVRQ